MIKFSSFQKNEARILIYLAQTLLDCCITRSSRDICMKRRDGSETLNGYLFSGNRENYRPDIFSGREIGGAREGDGAIYSSGRFFKFPFRLRYFSNFNSSKILRKPSLDQTSCF